MKCKMKNKIKKSIFNYKIKDLKFYSYGTQLVVIFLFGIQYNQTKNISTRCVVNKVPLKKRFLTCS